MTSLGIRCLEGFNGGLTQSFMLEVRDMSTQVIMILNDQIVLCHFNSKLKIASYICIKNINVYDVEVKWHQKILHWRSISRCRAVDIHHD